MKKVKLNINYHFLTKFLLLQSLLISSIYTFSQCCAGMGGSPIAGGAAQGVLLESQIELNTNWQLISTKKFYSKNERTDIKTFDGYKSTYEYFRLAYGVTKKLTMSIESGYYFNKKETGLNKNSATTFQSNGIGDLIFFPRYNIYNNHTTKHNTEVTLGLGFKVPLGSYNDSSGKTEEFSGQTYYLTKPTAVQLSSGSNDLILYAFILRKYLKNNVSLFANGFYSRKGYNPNGEKMGDFASVAFFAAKNIKGRLGATIQARFEWTNRMKIIESVYLYGKPSNYYPEATGYKKVFVTPQLNYTHGKFAVYLATDIPFYQYLNTSQYYSQAGSQFQTTAGLSYRFFTKQKSAGNELGKNYSCPMHPEEISDKPSKCNKCHMDLEEVK